MSTLKPPAGTGDHIQGNTHALIEMVEYGDYQCPHCGRAYPIIKKIQQKLGDQLKFVFRNFPLSQIHPDAEKAAIATEAAALQNKFWEMHDTIFEHQRRLADADLTRYAEQIGLDVTRFENDVKKPALLEKVQLDFESGIRSGVNGTPSFFINGEKYNGDWEEAPFLAYLQNLVR